MSTITWWRCVTGAYQSRSAAACQVASQNESLPALPPPVRAAEVSFYALPRSPSPLAREASIERYARRGKMRPVAGCWFDRDFAAPTKRTAMRGVREIFFLKTVESAPKRLFAEQVLYRPELTLTRQGSCIDRASRVADVVVWGGRTHNAYFGDA